MDDGFDNRTHSGPYNLIEKNKMRPSTFAPKKRYRERKKKEGICTHCNNKANPGNVLCISHLKKGRKLAKKYRKEHKLKINKRVETT